jgi:hypothetical protein
MRTCKLIGALAMVLAIGAISVATASAAEVLWKWLPGSAGETFTGKTGKITWQQIGGSAITCTKSLILLTFGGNSSELLKEGSTEGKDSTLALALMHVEGCKFAGLGINSVGDEKEIILIHLEIHNCMVATGDFGLLIKYLPVSLEVPSVKLTMALEGAFIALVTAEKEKTKFALSVKQTGGKQEIEKCKEGEAQTLKTKVDAGKNEQTGIEAAEPSITFDAIKDKEGEEMMEK